MPRPKQAPKSDVGGRERLLEAALRMFGTKGYAATTVRDILRAAGVTAPALYHHFGSKEGLFLALLNTGGERLEAAQAEALALDGTVVERIRAYCRGSSRVRREHANLMVIVDSILAGPPEAAPAFDFRGRFQAAVARLERLVLEGISNGELRACDPRDAALALLGTIEMSMRSQVFESASSAEESLEGMLSLILDGLVAHPGSRPGPLPRA